jgi:hypothetical protein
MRQLVWLGLLESVVGCTSRPVVETKPETSNLYVEPLNSAVVDKVDLLLVVDNSVSMADKQQLLAKAVPGLVKRLVAPRCVGEGQGYAASDGRPDACPPGTRPEFRAVEDMHVAVITSSLGSLGVKNGHCSDEPPDHDRAHLLPRVRPNLINYASRGFLEWDARGAAVPPGTSDEGLLASELSNMVTRAGDQGCGYESVLESWYRFLIDPEPPLSYGIDPVTKRNVASGIDHALLEQRAAFLRPDSLVAIVMLSDENDCSIRDDAFGHTMLSEGPMFRASSVCERDANDACCLPCATENPPEACALAQDPSCRLGPYYAEDDPAEHPNLRCFDQKRRFGMDLLFPTERYVHALTEPLIARRSDGKLVQNPLFEGRPGAPLRDKGLVFLAGIVGVPWQDIADDASLGGAGLRYLNAEQLAERGRWPVILGNPSTGSPPEDPFMQESVRPRGGGNPITGDRIAPASSLDPQENAINGHEQLDIDQADLQYACTFRLDSDPCVAGDCDCKPEHGDSGTGGDLARNRPLCQPPGGGPPQPRQYYAKAYPGLRQLSVIERIGRGGIVASICPKVLDEGAADYGYEPAVDAIVDTFRSAISGRCPPRPLAVSASADGRLPCVVVEASAASTCECAGSAGRRAPSPESRALVERELSERGLCESGACEQYCLCELEQAEGESLERCLNDPSGSPTPGYCYLDPFGEPAIGNPELVEGCQESKRLLRFVGRDTPQPGAIAFIACLGAALH